MVRSTGPLASLHAAGALGGVLTFRRSPRGTSIVHTSRPADPKSPAQLGARALMRLLQTIWTPLYPGYKDLWLPTPESSQHDAYLAFLKRNLLEFRTYHAPLLSATRLTSILSWSSTTTPITAEVHALRIKVNTTLNNLPNMYLVYRRLGGIPDEVQGELIGGTFAYANTRLDYLDVVPTLDAYGYLATRYDLNGQRSVSKTFAATAPLDS